MQGPVQAHGGRIRAESAGPGRGATVTFTLPIAGETGSDAAAVPPPGRHKTVGAIPGELARQGRVERDSADGYSIAGT